MDNEMMGGGSAWYKNKMVLAALALIVIVAGYAVFRGNGASNGGDVEDEKTEVTAQPKSGEIAVVGKLACTPLKSGRTPSASECVLGLQGNDGKFYALDTSKVESAEKDIQPTSVIKVIGKYTPANTASEEAGIFRYDGVMAVRVIALND
jgi:hypothetical protein